MQSVPLTEMDVKHLPLVTQSEVRCFRRCQREHRYRYQWLMRPVAQAEPLRFGRLVDDALKAYSSSSVMPLEAAMQACATAEDPFDRAKCEAMIFAYHVRWNEPSGLSVLGMGVKFECDIVNPKTGFSSRSFRLAGEVDGLLEDDKGAHWILERKTTSEEIENGSDYWAKLTIDAQISTYYQGVKALGYDVQGVLYDVLRKPGLRPQKATPHEAQKWTKPKDKPCALCAKAKKAKVSSTAPHFEFENGEETACVDGRWKTPSRLYAGQREVDEAPEEYRERLIEEFCKNAERYFTRQVVVRLVAEEAEAAADLWETVEQMRDARRLQRAPRNPDACKSWGRSCDFLPVCSGRSDINDPTLYRRAETAHEELAQ